MVKKNKTFRKIAATTAIASSLFVLNNKVNAEELENSGSIIFRVDGNFPPTLF